MLDRRWARGCRWEAMRRKRTPSEWGKRREMEWRRWRGMSRAIEKVEKRKDEGECGRLI